MKFNFIWFLVCFVVYGVSSNRRTAYYTRERIGIPLNQISEDYISNLTHLIYAFGSINFQTNRAQVTHYVSPDGNLMEDLNTLFQLKTKYRHLHTGISISDLFGDVSKSKGGNRGFAESIVKLIDDYGLDFVDLDWEFPVMGEDIPDGVKGSPDDYSGFVDLTKEIQTQFKFYSKENGFKPELSIAIPCPYDYLKNYDLTNLHPHVDMFHLMSYDHNTPNGDLIYHQSNLYSASDIPATSIHNTTQYMLNLGVPGDKIIMGIPAYAYTFKLNLTTPITSPDHILGTTYSSHSTTPDQLTQTLLNTLPHLYRQKYLRWDPIASSSYLYDPIHSHFVTLDTPTSVQTKLDYIRHYQLGGLFLWAVSWESVDDSLLEKFTELDVKLIPNHLNYPKSPYLNLRSNSKAITQSSLPNPLLLILIMLLTLFYHQFR